MKALIREAIGYLAASACALVVDVTILWALIYFLSIGYLAAATISFLAGAVVAYVLSVKLAFAHHRFQDRGVELVGFVLVGALGVAVNALVIFVAVSHFGLHYLTAKGVASCFTFTCNFVVRRQIFFVPRRAALVDQ